MRLTWHNYRYYPYERELAAREVMALLNNTSFCEAHDGLEVGDGIDPEPVSRLTYFAGYVNGIGFGETVQARLESAARNGKNRQATRYSVHGLHEYKGKFNPQVAKAILNIFGVRANDRVLDPFCGSGTTLIECAHLGAVGYGIDLNPLAIFLANAKLQALATPVEQLQAILGRLVLRIGRTQRWSTPLLDDPRSLYLQSWFDPTILQTIEIVGAKIRDTAGSLAPIFLAVASNLLRNYSLQDPHDLRIRRRKSPLPETPFPTAFLAACVQTVDRLRAAQAVLGTDLPLGRAALCDVNTLAAADVPALFDAAITSPPYAMALPYIDTQRLSLVWLGLCEPRKINHLDAALIGSREVRNRERLRLEQSLQENDLDLPSAQVKECQKLLSAIGPDDGFRRKAVPGLLYRYFGAMRDSFRSVRRMIKRGSRYALIVGHNHTVLSKVRRDIATPAHLSNLAQSTGWIVEEAIELQTYRRYGLHAVNAVEAETLLILRNGEP